MAVIAAVKACEIIRKIGLLWSRIDLNFHDSTKVEKRPFYRGSILERSAANNGKCEPSRQYLDNICVLVTERNRIRIQFVYVATVVKVSREQKKNPRGCAIHSKHYCPDKAIRFCSRTSGSPVAWIPIYLPCRDTRLKKRNMSEKGSNSNTR